MTAPTVIPAGVSEPVNHFEFVRDARRKLVEGYINWQAVAETYRHDLSGDGSRIYGGSYMAASYAYTLAAVLGRAAEVNETLAAELAGIAEELLTNGDEARLNDDVWPDPSSEADTAGAAK